MEEKQTPLIGSEEKKEKLDLSYPQSFWVVVKRSTPNILTLIFFQSVQILNLYYIGLVSSEKLAGVGLGNMLLNVFVFAMSNGLNGTVESFIAWALGSHNYELCGVRLNQARLIVMSVLTPFVIMFFFVDKILIALQQDPAISLMARNYVVWSLVGVLSLVQFDAMKRFVQVLNYSHVSTIIQCSTTLGHLFYAYYFIYKWDWGIAGAALALNLTYTLNFLIQELYVTLFARSKFDKYLSPLFDKRSLNMSQWCEFLKLGVPGTTMQCAEWWAFELLALFAGMLGTHQLAAQVAVINIIGLIYMIPLGVQFAAAGLVGEQFAENNAKQAKRFAFSAIGFAISIMIAVILVITFAEDWVAQIFTKDEEDIYYVKEVLGIVGLYLIADTVHGVQSGNVRGLGKQLIASIVTLVCYYAFGLPLAIWLGFSKEMDLLGFWLGFLIAMCILDAIVLYVVITADWTIAEAQAKKSVKDENDDGYSKVAVRTDVGGTEGTEDENAGTRNLIQ